MCISAIFRLIQRAEEDMRALARLADATRQLGVLRDLHDQPGVVQIAVLKTTACHLQARRRQRFEPERLLFADDQDLGAGLEQISGAHGGLGTATDDHTLLVIQE
jgi:hypothetical protein